jgi:predicted permease
MAGVLDDLRFELRGLAKSRGFTVVAVLSLALGMGANTTIFTLINGIFLRPLPVAEPARVAALFTLDQKNPGYLTCSYPNYKDIRDLNQVFSGFLLYSTIPLTITGRGEPQPIAGQLVSGNYFSLLGVGPVLGRAFSPEEDAVPGAHPVAVLSHGLWTRQFGADPAVVGRKINLNGLPYTVVGVAPPEFHGVNAMVVADIWVPFMMYQQVYPFASRVNERRALLFATAGRLKPGVTLAAAEQSLKALAAHLEREYPRENEGRTVTLMPLSQAVMKPDTRGNLIRAGKMLTAIAGLVLLIACANVANLLLVRAAGRSKEISIRLALGAGRGRIIRQLLMGSLLLSLAGGAAGLLVARWARDALWALRPVFMRTADFTFAVDARVVGFVAGLSVLTGVLFGLAPALRAVRADLTTELKERAGQAATGGGVPLRSVLVVGQVALALVALVGAGLFVRSLRQAQQFDAGFETGRMAIVTFDLGTQGYGEGRGRGFQRQVIERAASLPGVRGAALATNVPFGSQLSRTVTIEGQESSTLGKGRLALVDMVTPGYFRTVGIALLRGRDFTTMDTPGTPKVAVVNETMAAMFWPGQDVMGKRFFLYGDKEPVEVVGVARNANYAELNERPRAMAYLALAQNYFGNVTLHLRTTGSPESVLGAARHEIRGLDANLLLLPRTMPMVMRNALWAPRMGATLLGCFAALALLLASVGLYGVLAYAVRQRTREIGVRMALGATTQAVQGLILVDGMRLVTIGVVLGLAGAAAGSRVVQSLLFIVSPWDAAAFLVAPAVLSAVALAACWLPAWRAARVDPIDALRYE